VFVGQSEAMKDLINLKNAKATQKGMKP